MSTNDTHALYVITNLVNDKIYIGATKNPHRRWKEHIWHSGKTNKRQYIHKAIAHYGAQNFAFDILEEGLTHIDVINKEYRLIALYNTTNPDFGYNLAKGGFTLSPVKKGEENPLFGSKVTITEEQKQRLRTMNIGGKHSAETRELQSKIKSQHWAEGTYGNKKIYKYDILGQFLGEYNSLREARNSCGEGPYKSNHIDNVLDKINYTAHGFQWRSEYVPVCEVYTGRLIKTISSKKRYK